MKKQRIYNKVSDVKKDLVHSLQDQLFFRHPALNVDNQELLPENERSNPDNFFKDIAMFINLEDLYKVVDTCYLDVDLDYCPVLLQISQPAMLEHYNGNTYLLQVWDNNKTKVYEKSFKGIEDGVQYLNHVCVSDLTRRLKLKNFQFDNNAEIKDVVYIQGFLMLASADQIKLLQVLYSDMHDSDEVMDADNYLPHTIKTDLKIHGLIPGTDSVVAFETYDNQLEFNKLVVHNKDTFEYGWEQQKPVMPRFLPRIDEIKKVVHGIIDNMHLAVALRHSGAIDIYSDFLRRDTPENIECDDVDIVNGKFYFKLRNGEIYSFYSVEHSLASFDLATKVTQSDFTWESLKTQKVQNIANIYKGIQMDDFKDEQCIFIPHGRFLSLYHIAKKQWAGHFKFSDEICKTFRQNQSNIFLVLENGNVFDCRYFHYDSPIISDSSCNFTVPGKIIRTNEDIEGYMAFYLTVINDRNYELWVIYNNRLKRLLPDLYGRENLNACCLQFRDVCYVVIQNDDEYSLYKQDNYYYSDFSMTLVRKYNNIREIKGNLHNGTLYDPEDHLVLFDEVNMYVIKDKPYSIKVYPNVYCIGLQNFQNNYNYILCQEKKGNKNTGLRFFDMESVVKNEKLNNTLLKKLDIGTCGVFEWSGWIVRIIFIESLKNVVICPILHRNQHKFISVTRSDHMICRKIIKDKHISLSDEGLLQTHCIVTAKLLVQYKLPDFEEKNYGNMDRVALNQMKQVIFFESSEENIPLEQFFQDWELKPTLQNQKTCGQNEIESNSLCKFIVAEIKNEQEIKIHSVFYFPRYKYVRSTRDFRMHFNKTHDRMIVIVNSQKVCLYRSAPFQQNNLTPGSLDKEEPNMKTWVLIRQIDDYQVDFEDVEDTLTLITPEFTRYIINEKKERQFRIKDIETGFDICMIPKHLMTYENGEEPNHVSNRFKFLDHNTFIITSKTGIEKKIKITNKNELKEIDYNNRPLFNDILKEQKEEWKFANYYCKRPELSNNKNILERLKRRYQDYKTTYFLYGQKDRVKIYEALLNSDINWCEQNEHSFTFIHWSLIDQIRKGELKVEELEDSVIEQMLYNILPGGNTALHILCNRPDELMKLVLRAHPSEEKMLFHMPFLPNFKGQTPLHLMLSNNDFKSISFILKYLKTYEIDHHSRAIKDLFKNFIQEDILEFHEYIDARFLQTPQLQNFNRGLLNQDTNGIIAKEIEFNEEQLRLEIMESGVESRIKCEFLDLGGIYHFKDPDFDSFFDALGTTDNIQIFGRRSIQTLIEFNYDKVREYVVKKLFIAFLFYHLIYLIFTFLIFERYQAEQSELNMVLFYVFSAVLICFSTYFIVLELIQLKYEGFTYFESFWNYVDLVPPFGIYAVIIMIAIVEEGYSEITSTDIRIVFSIVTVFMWFKLLYFLRLFQNTSYLIRMIVEVVKDMRHFFLVIIITIVAFGNAMLSLSLGNEEFDEDGNPLIFTTDWIDSIIFTYRMILGDFDTSGFGEVAPSLVMILFLLCTIFNMIVMLNLLIAIISETFARVTANQMLATYQERASIIGENNYLIPKQAMEEYAPKNKMLMTIADLERIADERKDPFISSIDVLRMEMMDKFDEMKQKDIVGKMDELKAELKTQNDKQMETVTDLKRMIKVMTKKTESIQTKLHREPLTNYYLHEVEAILNRQYQQWECSAEAFKGCLTRENRHQDEYEMIYYCDKCEQNYDICKQCYLSYSNIHFHDYKTSTFKELQAKYPAKYQYGFDCKAAQYKGCKNKDKFPTEDLDWVFYYDLKAEFGVCSDCVKTYKV